MDTQIDTREINVGGTKISPGSRIETGTSAWRLSVLSMATEAIT